MIQLNSFKAKTYRKYVLLINCKNKTNLDILESKRLGGCKSRVDKNVEKFGCSGTTSRISFKHIPQFRYVLLIIFGQEKIPNKYRFLQLFDKLKMISFNGFDWYWVIENS